MDSKMPSERPPILTALDRAISENTRIHVNVSQVGIVTTLDKATLYLREHATAQRARKFQACSASALLAMILQFISGDFQPHLGISGEAWEAIFVLATLFTAVTLCWATVWTWRTRRFRSIEKVLDLLQGKIAP